MKSIGEVLGEGGGVPYISVCITNVCTRLYDVMMSKDYSSQSVTVQSVTVYYPTREHELLLRILLFGSKLYYGWSRLVND